MKADEIRKAVDAGKTVKWSNDGYEVQLWASGYEIVCLANDHAIGLTYRDNTTLNGKEEDFYVKS